MKRCASARPCAHCVARVFNLLALLESSLGLSLRVPQSCMLAAYPPEAHYQRHFDSYGGRDIPRYVTVLLYLGWRPRSGGGRGRWPAGAAASAAHAASAARNSGTKRPKLTRARYHHGPAFGGGPPARLAGRELSQCSPNPKTGRESR